MIQDVFWALYLIDILSSWPALFLAPAFTGALVLAVSWIIDDDRPASTYQRHAISGACVGVVMGLFMILIPSKSTMYIMLGVHTTERFTETEIGQKLEAYVSREVDKFLNK